MRWNVPIGYKESAEPPALSQSDVSQKSPAHNALAGRWTGYLPPLCDLNESLKIRAKMGTAGRLLREFAGTKGSFVLQLSSPLIVTLPLGIFLGQLFNSDFPCCYWIYYLEDGVDSIFVF